MHKMYFPGPEGRAGEVEVAAEDLEAGSRTSTHSDLPS